MCRNILGNKLHSIINVTGLAIGISSFIMILLYVHHELTYDRFQRNLNRIYKFTLGENFNTNAPLAVVLKDKIPEIEKIVRLDFQMGGGKSALLRVKEGSETKTVQVKDIIYADSTFFDVFSYRVIQGNAKTSLTEPYSIILTESTSHKIFGKDDPVGKTIEFIGTNENPRLNYTVSAVIEDIPNNSSIKFNGIVSFNTLKSIKPGGVDVDEDNANWTYDTYVLTKNFSSVDELTRKTNKIWLNYILKEKDIKPGSESAKEYVAGFVPLKDVNFYLNNKIKFIYLILFVGIIIIIIAVINFINLSIAKASLRTKEIGVKKVTGSSRYDLIKQFMSESLALTFIAASFALIIVSLLMPLFNEITGKSVSLNFFQNPTGILIYITGSILIGILAGIYPALYLSAFKPLAVFKNIKIGANRTKGIIQSLIIFQFVISVALIISTIIITRQVKFMRTENVGFDNKNIIICQLPQNIRNKYDVFKQRLLQDPDIINVGTSSGEWLSEQFHIGFTNEINGSEKSFDAMFVDPDFNKTIGFKIIEGRDFSPDLETDKYNAIILNETAVKYFGLDNPIGFKIELLNDFKAQVIGVVNDFHNESFQKAINPLVLWYVPGQNYNLSVRISSNDIQKTVQYIDKQWREFSPDIPFEFHFLDEEYDALYKDEDKFNLVISYFSVIAILIACLGLFGVVSFSTENRTKEIGIRKVNGAKVTEVLIMLNKDFIKWIIIAFVIACPIAWYAMHKWLQNFAYKTELSWWVFAAAGAVALAVTLLTVSIQSYKAATRNPVEALRYE
jgi:putative ABC transport system permease protein